ncbi:MAG: D-alanyl-D-alanine carboxypeptidase family protein [Clostridia bacterium]|nr:D-alanyl-D-alanine carboxypeptidase family protein [Clostridia bacterium]
MNNKRCMAALAAAVIISCSGCMNKSNKPESPKFNTPDSVATFDEPSDIDTASDSDSNTDTESTVLASQVSAALTILISDESLDMKIGDSKTINANVIPSNEQVVWKSSDDSIAAVDESGTIKAVRGGKCTVTACASSNSSIKADITVNVAAPESAAPNKTVSSETVSSNASAESSEPEKITASKTVAETHQASSAEPEKLERISLGLPTTVLTTGQLVTPIITAFPANVDAPQVTITTSDSGVVYVNEDGTLWAASEGACTITVTAANDKSITDSVIVAVTDPQETPTPAPEPTPVSSEVIYQGYENDENNEEYTEEYNEENEQTYTNEDDNPRENFYVDGILIVNKTYSIPASYNPGGLTWECASAFERLRSAAAADGINIYLSSGFRSYDYQAMLYNGYCAYYGQASADTFSARPGHSEHQTGLAIDCNIINDSFIGTPEAIWLENHCHEYGFIIRYPYGKDYITGYKYEPWHIRYIGDKATDIYESGLTLEEYYGLSSVYGG